jgi:hypothetical protein
MWHFADLRFADPIIFVIYGLKTSARPQMHTFSPLQRFGIYATAILSFKVQSKKIVLKRRLLGLFCGRVVQYFVEICGFYGLIMKTCGFADWHTRKFADLR